MWQVILLVVGVVMATIGTVMIYDARILTKRFFSFGDQNDASLGLKILGFLIAIGGALLVFFKFELWVFQMQKLIIKVNLLNWKVKCNFESKF